MITGNTLFDAKINKNYQAVLRLLDSNVSVLPWNKLTYRQKEESWLKNALERQNAESHQVKTSEIKEIPREDEISLTKQQVEQYDQETQQSWLYWAWRSIVGENKQLTLNRYWLYYMELKRKLRPEGIANKPLTLEEKKIEAIRRDVNDYAAQTISSWRLWLWRNIFGENSEITLKRRWLVYQYYKTNIETLSSGLMMKKDTLLLAIDNLKRMGNGWLPRKWSNVINSFKAIVPRYFKLILRGKSTNMSATSRPIHITPNVTANKAGKAQARTVFQLIPDKIDKSRISHDEKKQHQKSEIELKSLYQRFVYLCGFFGIKYLLDVIAIASFQKLKVLQSEITADFEHAYMSLQNLSIDEKQELFGVSKVLLTINTRSLIKLFDEIGHLQPQPSAYLNADEMQDAFQQGQEASNKIKTTLSTAKPLIARANALSESKQLQDNKKSFFWPFHRNRPTKISVDAQMVVHPSVKYTLSSVHGYITLLHNYYTYCAVLDLDPYDPKQEITLEMINNAYAKLKVELQPDKAIGERNKEHDELTRKCYDDLLIQRLGMYFSFTHRAYEALKTIFDRYKGPPFILFYPPVQKYLIDIYLEAKRDVDPRPDRIKEAKQIIENVKQRQIELTCSFNKKFTVLVDNFDRNMDIYFEKLRALHKISPKFIDLDDQIAAIQLAAHIPQKMKNNGSESEESILLTAYDVEFAKYQVIMKDKVNQRIEQLRQLLQQTQHASVSPSGMIRPLHQEMFPSDTKETKRVTSKSQVLITSSMLTPS